VVALVNSEEEHSSENWRTSRGWTWPRVRSMRYPTPGSSKTGSVDFEEDNNHWRTISPAMSPRGSTFSNGRGSTRLAVVSVTISDEPVADAQVELVQGGKTWSAFMMASVRFIRSVG